MTSYLPWDEELGYDSSSYDLLITYDDESLLLFDLSDPGLFLFPDINPRACSHVSGSSEHSTTTATGTATGTIRSSAKQLKQDYRSGPPETEVFPQHDASDIWPRSWHSAVPQGAAELNLKCDICARQCRDSKALQQHKRCHLKTYQCSTPKCHLRFSTRRDLNRHRDTVHPTNGKTSSAPCPYCSRRFSRQDNLKRHVIGHHRPAT
ncbi:hypothetical protein GE09DRAFT_729169 [Coniochaeta sp. 2T2.1]|nr:hypothetical protein GE09DRAFT_729169 [Coniochaeta sp. 2T2.1]